MLKRLRETICMPNKFYSEVTDSVPKSMKESLNRFNNTRMQESLENDKVLQILKESKIDNSVITKVVNRLHEHGLNKSPRIFRLPVARMDNLNGNGRIYPEALWYNVMNNQEDAWKQNVGLCDHPSDDDDPGSLKNAAIVWLAMEIDRENKLVYGIGSFVGPYGHLAQEIIDAGGKVGFSTSGFGELEADETTVNPDTYQIERLADCVLNPSQSVYGDISDEANNGNIEYTKQYASDNSAQGFNQVPSMHESIEKNKENRIMENKENAVKNALSKVEEKELRKHIRNYLRENTEITNPVKQLADLKEIQNLIQEGQLTDLEDSVKVQLNETQKRIEEMVELGLKAKMKESEVTVETDDGTKVTVNGDNAPTEIATIDLPEETETSIADISEDSDLSNLTLEQESTIRKYSNKFFSESHKEENPLKTLEEANNILKVVRESKLEDLEALAVNYIGKLQESINKDMSDMLAMKKALKADNIKKITESTEILMNNSKIMVNDINKYKNLCESLAQKNSQLVKEYQSMKEKMELIESKGDEADLQKNQKIVSLTQKLDELKEAYDKLDETAGTEVQKLEEALKEKDKKIAELKESVNKYSKGNATLEKKNGLLESQLRATERKLENTKYELEEALDNMVEKQSLKENKKEAPKAEVKKEPVPMNEATPKAKEDKLNETIKTVANDSTGNYLKEEINKINEYYKDLEERFGEAIKPYKEYITGAEKFREAQRRWLAVMDKVDTSFREAVNAAKVPSTEVKLQGIDRMMDLNKIQESSAKAKFGLM